MAASRYIAFLRAINVGGRTVPMARLRALFEDLGLDAVETFIASGNVLFETRAMSAATLEKRIETALLKAFGYEVSTFVRTRAEVAAIAAARPFAAGAMAAALALNVAFLRAPLDARGVRTLGALRTPIDDFRATGSEVYWMCKKRQSESDFSNAVFEKALGVRATFRGMNTVRRLAEKYPPR
ncbi:MAG: DUF1697 domain-containing protein [Candidatus Krumholzibacteria bacterium]|nr:DUF1697 domain-containing protein [Candidatus Krumholzibacteria bacterium]MDH4336096.1 DUF1697 domain-containing protein [Candidatus Krumholzibacteria bacterium]MDH5268737.1 DUF1697 domain-containing protein [Candidatus Krumholzibacteria bacterium]MDH5627194.1 DUF1697 domain-containing protein [Candidatus Krumholzibacteria bacterium]